jgi:hypothetical protein
MQPSTQHALLVARFGAQLAQALSDVFNTHGSRMLAGKHAL